MCNNLFVVLTIQVISNKNNKNYKNKKILKKYFK